MSWGEDPVLYGNSAIHELWGLDKLLGLTHNTESWPPSQNLTTPRRFYTKCSL